MGIGSLTPVHAFLNHYVQLKYCNKLNVILHWHSLEILYTQGGLESKLVLLSLFGFISLHLLIGEKMRKVVFLRTLLGNVSTHIGGKSQFWWLCCKDNNIKIRINYLFARVLFIKQQLTILSPKKSKWFETWLDCYRRLHDYSNSFYYILNDVSHLQKFKCTPS